MEAMGAHLFILSFFASESSVRDSEELVGDGAAVAWCNLAFIDDMGGVGGH